MSKKKTKTPEVDLYPEWDMTVEDACQFCGVAIETFARWYRKTPSMGIVPVKKKSGRNYRVYFNRIHLEPHTKEKRRENAQKARAKKEQAKRPAHPVGTKVVIVSETLPRRLPGVIVAQMQFGGYKVLYFNREKLDKVVVPSAELIMRKQYEPIDGAWRS